MSTECTLDDVRKLAALLGNRNKLLCKCYKGTTDIIGSAYLYDHPAGVKEVWGEGGGGTEQNRKKNMGTNLEQNRD